jgi:hypothetical protein
MDLGDPISYLVLREGVDVLSSDGQRIGTVEHVLADSASDTFDGVIIDVREGPGGHRFADADQVGSCHERALVLNIDAAAAESLPAPTANPATMEVDPAEGVPHGLGAKLRRAWDYLSGKY